MSTNHPWLQQLNEATDYRQLQSVFSQMTAEASRTSDGEQLVASIDEAIVRIEQERTQDDEELREFESRYTEFKEQQRGVLGWFRRHVPFTKTRRQEVQHKDAIADQRAEILADNLVIARAQMLKQKLLPPAERQLGESVQRWQSQLANGESIERISDYASTIESLAAETSVSDAFVNEIRAEIDSFAKADFASKEDQQRKRQDIEQARRELAELESELHEEHALRTAATGRAGELVTEELLQSDHDFYQLTQQIERLRTGKRLAKNAAAKADDFANLLGEIQRLTEESETCTHERDKFHTERERLRRDLETAHERLEKSERKLAKASGPLEEARSSLDRADAALDAVKRIYDQHRQANPESEGASNDEIRSEYDRLSKEHKKALQRLELVKAPHDSVKSKYDRRKQVCDDVEHEFEKIQQAAKQNDERYERLSDEIQDASEKLPQLLAEFEPELNLFLQSIEAIPFQSHVETLNRTLQWSATVYSSTAPTGGQSSDLRSDDSARRIKQLVDAIEKDERELKKMASAARKESDERWSRRCRELLGDEVATLVCAS